MLKKTISFIITIMLICCSSAVFANNNGELHDSMNKASNSAKNVIGGTENAVENVAGKIGTGVKNLGNSFTDGAMRMTNDGDNMNGKYTAMRTATNTDNGTILGMSANTWTWFILAVVGIAIVGLVWYYAAQNNNEYNHNNE